MLTNVVVAVFLKIGNANSKQILTHTHTHNFLKLLFFDSHIDRTNLIINAFPQQTPKIISEPDLWGHSCSFRRPIVTQKVYTNGS